MQVAWAGLDDDQIASFSGQRSKSMMAGCAGEARQIVRRDRFGVSVSEQNMHRERI